MNRYVLIDYMHLAHKCVVAQPLTANVNIGGEISTIDTTIPNYTIKDIFRCSGGTRNRFFTGVFFEGGNSRRRDYFAQLGEDAGTYKGNRPKQSNPFYRGVDLAINLLHEGKVSIYRVGGCEADDIIASMVAKIQSIDPVTPIDVITNDTDLLPLVDDQVSVYMRGSREFSLPGCPTLTKYYQVTPETWSEYLSYTSAYRKYFIPYNSMLLYKFMRGDSADEYEGATKGFGGVKYSALMQQMVEDGVDFPNVFRYNKDFDEVMRPVLSNYFPVETVDYMKFIFDGIKPPYSNLDIPKQVELGLLQTAVNPVKIKLVK